MFSCLHVQAARFQCPRGHFCFSDRGPCAYWRARLPVSMPARAFLLFGRESWATIIFPYSLFQCPRGHFCFSDDDVRILDPELGGVSMPARAFLLFGHFENFLKKKGYYEVSMPARAFLLFGQWQRGGSAGRYHRVSMPARAFLLFGRAGGSVHPHHSFRFNAREGIFAFRTTACGDTAPILNTSFNAREGIFAFRTNCYCVWANSIARIVSMPARAFLLFGLKIPTEAEGCTGAFQCPRGHFCFSDEPVLAARRALCAGFNAREGIFAFRTNPAKPEKKKSTKFQCPRGHFCFSDKFPGRMMNI